jgi:hypothetical protein
MVRLIAVLGVLMRSGLVLAVVEEKINKLMADNMNNYLIDVMNNFLYSL